ncbi:histidine kinase [Pseudanabaena sp. FACHB-2040]|uniref:histidine kinase n=1 Tax=Pseudanabaena sp. FACHB-2040 TaxID=2692859 RepID=UPI0016879F26|nr:histidine kinase [Pseudanabaena sp. FACHB-2040]MBD2259626.1 histidine kinase [Pseudanabaena sp. FACHB-2040]
MATPCHILVEDNPVIIYASRNGTPEKVTRMLSRFLATFAEERETAGEFTDTPECLAAQIVVRFGFEICEDDFSNLKVGLKFYPDVDYLYFINQQFQISVWLPQDAYRTNPNLGLKGCQPLAATPENR